jgi:hypothetical protein
VGISQKPRRPIQTIADSAIRCSEAQFSMVRFVSPHRRSVGFLLDAVTQARKPAIFSGIAAFLEQAGSTLRIADQQGSWATWASLANEAIDMPPPQNRCKFPCLKC